MTLPTLLLRDTEACRLLGLSRATLWRRVQDGTLPAPVRIGGATRFLARDIERAVAAAVEARDASGAADAPQRLKGRAR